MRLLMLLVALLVISGVAVGFAARWQLIGLLDVADRVWNGRAGAKVAGPIAYGPSPQQAVDVYRPKGVGADARLPVIVWFHGGGWDSGGREFYGFAGRALAAEGFVVVVAGHRLGGAGRWPGFMEDGAAAVRWTHANIATHGGDPQRIILSGHSAGAHIAALLALDTDWLGDLVRPGGAVRGVGGLAGPYDFLPFEAGGSADRAMGHADPIAATQPITYARGDAPMLWLASGDADRTVRPRNSRALADAVKAAGGRAETKLYAGVDHREILTGLSLPLRNDAPTMLADLAAFARQAAGSGEAQRAAD
jgi:acetyl esterase/lipase